MADKNNRGVGKTALLVAVVAIGLYVITIVLNT
jgi:hypothetical protein